MKHIDHINLIKKAITEGGVWADFGSGWGAFTLAIREIAGPTVEIYSVDHDGFSLEDQDSHFQNKFPGTNISYIEADFTKPLNLPLLNGILMANSLHFVKDQPSFLSSIKSYLKPNGKVVIVEYNVDEGNTWVPFPVSFEEFKNLTSQAGFRNTEFLESVPSEFLNELYSAQTFV